MTNNLLIGGAPIHYEIRGAGRPIVMLHGFAVDRHSMIGCMEPVFADRPDWQRIYLDLPGMGETPAAPHLSSTDALRDMVLTFADHVIPGQRFAIAGKSYGGYLTRGVVSRCPERIEGAAFICPTVVADREARDVPELTVIARDDAVLERLSKEERDEFTPYFSVQDDRTWEGSSANFCRACAAPICAGWPRSRGDIPFPRALKSRIFTSRCCG
jgi:pimeloyl-ACP methyl ester carboxylesterase